MGVHSHNGRESTDLHLPHCLRAAELFFQVNAFYAAHGLREHLRGAADGVQIYAVELPAGRKGLLAHAAFADDSVQLESFDKVCHVWSFARGCCGAGGHYARTSFVLYNNGSAMIDEGVCEVAGGSRSRCKVFVDCVTAGENCTAEKDEVADMQ